MKKPGKSELWQASSLLLCLIVGVPHMDWLGASEFSGGRITGPLLSIFQSGPVLFFLALVMTFFYRKIGAVLGLVAALLCFPLYFYFTVPGLFRSVFRGKWSVPLQAYFVWDVWTMAGILTLGIAAIICIRCLYPLRGKTISAKNA
jgi:hypothetical protein